MILSYLTSVNIQPILSYFNTKHTIVSILNPVGLVIRVLGQHRFPFELHRMLLHEMRLMKGRSVHMNGTLFTGHVTVCYKNRPKLYSNQKSRFPDKVPIRYNKNTKSQ